MGHFQRPVPSRLSRYHGIAVILRGDFDFSGDQILHRMVAAAVTEFQLIGFGAVGQGDHLVAQANAEDGILAPSSCPDESR